MNRGGQTAPLASGSARALTIEPQTASRARSSFRSLPLNDSTEPFSHGLPRTTLQRVHDDLIAAGVLRLVGDGRGTRYARADADVAPPFSARQQHILCHIEKAGWITRLECANTTGTSLRTASRDLRQLVERGYLWVANYYSARNPLRLSSLVILGVVARMFRCATRSSCWCT